MPYSPQTWTDDDPLTPISAARLAHMETGIDEAHDDIATLDTALTGVANGLTDLETEVGTIDGVPAGGTTGQVLAKTSNLDGATGWATPGAAANGIPAGGTATQMLAKASGTDFDAEWVDAPTGGGGGGAAVAVQASRPVDNVTRASANLGSLSTPWTDTITATVDQPDVVFDVRVSTQCGGAESVYVALAVDGVIVDRVIVPYAGPDVEQPGFLHGIVEGLTPGAHTFEVYVASNSGSTVTVSSVVDTAIAVGTNVDGTSVMLLTQPGAVAAAAAGGGALVWEQLIDDPLTSLTGWTAASGTWTIGPGGVVRQSNTGGSPYYLNRDEQLFWNMIYAEVEIKFAASAGNIYAGFQLGWGNGGILARYQREGGVWGVKLERSIVQTVALDTWDDGAEGVWFKLGMMIVGNSIVLYDNTGARRLSGAIAGDPDTSAFTLMNYGADAEYRNLKVWGLMPAELPPVAGAGAGSSPSLLGITAYRAATDVTFSTTSTTLVDVDATNLHVPFVAPASGAVIVQVNALVNSGANRGRMGLRDAAGIIPDTLQYVSSGDFAHMSTYRCVVDGLTPGDSYDWRLAFAHSAAATMSMYSGPEFGQITITVHDAAPGSGSGGASTGGWASADNPASFEAAFGADLGFDYEFDAVGTTLPAGWSWVNQATASYREELGAGVLSDVAGASDNCRLLVRSLAGAPSTWEAVAKCCMSSPAAGGGHFGGICVRDSVTGEFTAVYLKPFTGVLAVEHWNSPTSFNASVGGPSIGDASSALFYVKIVVNSGSDWDFYWSKDGRAWSVVALNVNEGAFLTADQIGFMLNANGGSIGAELSFEFLRLR